MIRVLRRQNSLLRSGGRRFTVRVGIYIPLMRSSRVRLPKKIARKCQPLFRLFGILILPKRRRTI